MVGQLLYPPNYVSIEGPVIFLAGPIQGAPAWQVEAAKILRGSAPHLHIASPRGEPVTETQYEAQVDWETYHLRRAAQEGAILFWLAKEAEHRCDRSYAQTSRFELGEWKMRHERDGVKIVVGIEEGFSGARYIRRRLSQDCPGIPICRTLEETCQTAIQKIYSE